MNALNCCTIAFFCIMFPCTFPTSGFPFAVCSAMAVLAAIEALHYLELRSESFWLVIEVVDVAPVCDTSVCYMIVVKINHDRAVFRFAGGCFVFTSKKSDFRDS